jgi:hypothetical protein
MHIGTRIPHVSLTNIKQLLGDLKKNTIFQYWPDMCCMCACYETQMGTFE